MSVATQAREASSIMKEKSTNILRHLSWVKLLVHTERLSRMEFAWFHIISMTKKKARGILSPERV